MWLPIDNFIAMNKIEFLGAGREALFVPVALPKIGKTKAPGIVLLPAIAGERLCEARCASPISKGLRGCNSRLLRPRRQVPRGATMTFLDWHLKGVPAR